MSEIRTVVELDMVGYSDIARQLEQEADDPEVVDRLNQEIQQFVDYGLEVVGQTRNEVVKATNGDNAVIVFESAIDAHLFAQAVHQRTQTYNAQQQGGFLAKRWFRIGCATGKLYERPRNINVGDKISGIVIADAYRLEKEANPGELLIDEATYKALIEFLETNEQSDLYNDIETVYGKREEKFPNSRRWQVIPRVPLMDLIEEDVEVRDTVYKCFRDLDDTYQIVDCVQDYKSLHDNFQNLENELRPLNTLVQSLSLLKFFEIFKEIQKYKPSNSPYNTNKSLIRTYIHKVLEILDKGNQESEYHLLIYDDWKTNLNSVIENLNKACNARKKEDYRYPLECIINDLNFILYNKGITFLNSCLVASAKKIVLDNLIEDLNSINSLYSSKCKIFDQNQLDEINQNIQEISIINQKLTNMLNLHNDLQFFDDRFRNIESELNKLEDVDDEIKDRTIRQIFRRWNKLYPTLIRLLSLQDLPDHNYTESISKQVQSTNDKISISDSNGEDNIINKKEEFQYEFSKLAIMLNQYFRLIDDGLNTLIQTELITTFYSYKTVIYR